MSENKAPDSTDSVQDENDNLALSQFHQQLSKIISDAESKIMVETKQLNLHFTSNMSTAIQEERDRHTEEKNKLLQEINELHRCVGSLESIMEARRCSMESVFGKLQVQHNLFICSKAFYSWKLFVQNKKREAFLSSLALKHYERNLKQKAFSWWYAHLKAVWKKQMELKAHVEVVEMQKRIVNLYEARIKNLQDNLSEAGRKISSLQSKHRLFEESVKMPCLPEAQSLNAKNYLRGHSRAGTSAFSEKVTVKPTETADASVCPECALENNRNYITVPMRYYTNSVPSSLTRVLHADDLLADNDNVAQESALSLVGFSSDPYLCQVSGTEDAIHVPKPDKLVVRHVPQHQTYKNAKPSSRPQSGKFSVEKKVV